MVLSEFSVEEGASTPPPNDNPPPTQRLEVGVLPSAHADKLDRKAKDYFKELPTAVKEQIMQSGVEFTTKEELQDFFEMTLSSGDD